MSESLRDLVVSLSLNSDNFTQNIKSVSAQIREAESAFKLAGAGVTKFEATTAGLSAKMGMLQQKVQLQKSAVDQYQKVLTAANTKLTESVARNDKNKASLDQAKAKYADLGKQIDLAKVRYDAWNSALGDGHPKTQQAKAALDVLQKEYQETGAEVERLSKLVDPLAKHMQRSADEVSRAKTELNQAQAELRETEAEIKKCTLALKASQSAWTMVGKGMTAFGKSATAIGKAASSLGKELTRYLTAPITALGGFTLKTSLDFEDAFAGVRKTVQMTESDYQKLDQAIREMTLVKPATYEEIAFVAETAGQLGVAEQAVAGFSSVMTDLGEVCTDLDAEQAATGLAKLANIMGVTGDKQTTEYFERLGSTVLDLGINSASTESSIIEMAMRLAAAARQVGLTEAQVLGYASALSSVGIEAQMGGTAFSKALIKMEVASQTGGQALTDFAKVGGMTSKAFKALFDTDPGAAFEAFIAGLAKMDDEGMSAIATLDEIGFREVRLRDTTLRMVNATELMRSMQTRANKAWSDNTAIHDLVSERYDTTAKRLEMLKNQARLAASTFSDVMVPTLEDLMGSASGWLDNLMEMDEAQRKQIVSTGLWALAAGPALSVFGKLSTGIGAVAGTLGKFATKVGDAGGGLEGLISTIAESGPAILGVTAALATGIYLFYDWASGARACREAMEGMNATADKWRQGQANSVYSNGGLAAFGLDEQAFLDSSRSADQWLVDVLALWSDGKKETDTVINEYIGSFEKLNTGTKSALEKLEQTARESGRTDVADGIKKDMDELDKVNAEIAKLLKKRQNKNLSDKDKLKLQELIDTKEAIEIKYHLTPKASGGYAKIQQDIETEIARAQARGQKGADPVVYEQGLTATAQGYAAIREQVDQWYASEYAVIQLIEDEAEREAARKELDAQYNAQRKAAAEEYANALRKLVAPVWEDEGIQQAGKDMDAIMQLFRQYSTEGGEGFRDPALLTRMNELVAGMNKDDLISYLGVLQQVQALLDGGMSVGEVDKLFHELDFSNNLDQFAQLADFAKNRSGELQGLADILNNIVPQELQKIAVELDMTVAEARWAEFASNPGAITTEAIITSYSEAPEAVVPQPVVDALVASYGEIEGGADTVMLAPDDVVAQVAAYLEGEGCSIAALKPDQVEAIVNKYSEATGADKSTSLSEFTAYITHYDDTQAVKPTTKLTTSITVTGYDLAALEAFKQNNPVEVQGIIRLGEVLEKPEDVLNDPNAKFYLDGQQISVDVVPKNRITDDTLFAYDEDGTMHVMVTPEIQGTPESVDEALPALDKRTGGFLFGTSTTTQMQDAVFRSKEYETAAKGINLFGVGTSKVINEAKAAIAGFDETEIAALSTFIQEIVTAINNGEQVSDEALAQLQLTVDFIKALDTMGIGQNITAGIGDAMAQAGFAGNAELVASNLESALNAALGISSPTTRMMPVGQNAAAGVAQGMMMFSFGSAGSTLMAGITAALSGLSAKGKTIGQQFSRGLASGITSGTDWIKTAARTAALAAKNAAEAALDERSPSRVGRDIGGRFSQGIALGVADERQLRAIQNASRYIANSLSHAAGQAITHDYRRNYSTRDSGNVTVNVDRLTTNDRQDVRALALELSRLNRCEGVK